MPQEASTSLITTAGLPEKDRLPFWRETASNLFGVDTMPVSSQPFFGELTITRVKEFAFMHLRCRGHRCSGLRVLDKQARKEAVVVTVLLSGKSRSMHNGQELVLGPGDIRILDTTRPFLANMEDEYEAFSFEVPRETWVRRVGPTEQITARAVHANTFVGGLLYNFFRQLMPDIGKVEPATAEKLAEVTLAMANTLAGVCSQGVSRSSGRLLLFGRAKTLIEENLYDPNLSPEKIARALRISERYLRKLFQEQGTTVSNWLWDRRVEKSRQRLSDPSFASQSITEIAYGCGFSDFSHFGHRFKAAFSMSPSEFRHENLPTSKPR